MTITNRGTGKRMKRPAAAVPPSRLPSTRERRPALAALAVLLIAGGAVLAGWLALRQSQTESYLYIDTQVNEGEQIKGEHLSTVELPSEGVNFISAGTAREIIDTFARADLLEGTVLVPGMTGSAPDLRPDEVRLGMDLEAGGQYPPGGMSVGDSVIVYVLDSSGDSRVPLLETSGVVRSIQETESGAGAVVDVVISANCSGEIAGAAAEGNITLGGVPPNASEVECRVP